MSKAPSESLKLPTPAIGSKSPSQHLVHGDGHGKESRSDVLWTPFSVWLNACRDKMQRVAFNRVMKRRLGASSLLACSSARGSRPALGPDSSHSARQWRLNYCRPSVPTHLFHSPLSHLLLISQGPFIKKRRGASKAFSRGQTKSPLCLTNH